MFEARKGRIENVTNLFINMFKVLKDAIIFFQLQFKHNLTLVINLYSKCRTTLSFTRWVKDWANATPLFEQAGKCDF